MKPVRVSDLKDQIGTTGPRPFLYCPHCGQESSANRSDYFASRIDEVFRCCDGTLLELVTRRVQFIPSRP